MNKLLARIAGALAVALLSGSAWAAGANIHMDHWPD